MRIRRNIISRFATLILPISVILFCYTNVAYGQSPPRLIAHAGGEIYGIRLTNSLQAVNNSYDKGFRFFELDMDWTSDGIPVLIHDWGNSNWFLNIRHSTEPQTFKEFKTGKAALNLQFMDLDLLEKWISTHADTTIITDVKKENIKLLTAIKENYPYLFSHIIPQVYTFEEYDCAKELGYKEITLSLYRLKVQENEIVEFCMRNPVFSVAIYSENLSDKLIHELNGIGVKTYIHTVNDYNEYLKFREKEAFGVYTDYFEPDYWIE